VLQTKPAIRGARMRLPTVEDAGVCEGRGLLASNSVYTGPSTWSLSHVTTTGCRAAAAATIDTKIEA
jgi:hypothetical protein